MDKVLIQNGFPDGRTESASVIGKERFILISLTLLGFSSISILFSIAVSEILLGLALLAFLLSRSRLEKPPLWQPLAAFAAWTVVSLVLAGPVMRGLPQVKKVGLFLILLLGYTLFRQAAHSARVIRAMIILASLASVASMVEFIRTYLNLRAIGHDFYLAYSLSRVTGFMGHWMTFSGQQMLVLMMLLAWLVAAKQLSTRELALGWTALAVLVVALLLAFTRGVWLGCLAGGMYLLWQHRRRWLIALPVAGLLCYMVAPGWMQMRARSIATFETDNTAQARIFMWRTGMAMVKAHPIVGIGPEGPRYEFDKYRPDAYMPPAWYGHLHNNFLQMAAERGLPGLAIFVWLLGAAMVGQVRLARRFAESPYAYLAHGAAAATIALAVAGFFEYNFGDSEVLILWLALLVSGYSIGHQQPAAKPAEPPKTPQREAVAVA